MPKQVDYTSKESMLSVNPSHMWRHSSGIDLDGQIKIRQCRVARLTRLNAPAIIKDRENQQLMYLLNRKAKLEAASAN